MGVAKKGRGNNFQNCSTSSKVLYGCQLVISGEKSILARSATICKINTVWLPTITLPGIISCHQTGFQRGKSTTDNLILMYLVLEYYERNPEEEGYLVQIDFEKAFDSVEHDYLFSVLKKIGIGNQLIHMINARWPSVDVLA